VVRAKKSKADEVLKRADSRVVVVGAV